MLREKIRDIPDFPRQGIIFKDITTLLKDAHGFSRVIDELASKYSGKQIDYVVAIESRGFIFGAPLAYRLGVGFIPIRKKGKLPGPTERMEYDLEYGTDVMEIHKDAIEPGKRVLVVDDLLATGGTISAAMKLIEKVGGKIVGTAFVIELSFLKGKEKLKEFKTEVTSLIEY